MSRVVALGSKRTAVRKNRKRKLPKLLTPAEAKRLLQQPDLRTFDGVRDRCMLELMYRAGLRVGEVCNLLVRDVDDVNGEIRIFDGKGGDGTAYFDPERVSPLLASWLDRRAQSGLIPNAGRPLFCREDGQRMNTRYVQRMVKRFKDQAGIEARCTPHTLRHTFATELLNEGFSLREVQAALRHRNVGTTEIYTHVIDTQLRGRINRRSA